MKIIFLALSLTALAGQAKALSCMRPDPIITFQRVAAAPEAYHVLYGRLTFDEAALPVADFTRQNPDPAPIPAQFRGSALTSEGFTVDYDSPAILQPVCVGPWCGGARSGVDAVYFVRADQSQVVMMAQPCGGMIFEQLSSDVLDMLTSCMKGGTCLSQPFEQ